MADSPRTDLLGAWLDSVRQLRSVAGSIADPPEAVHQLQALQEDIVRGMFLPVDTLLQVADQLAEPLREQAQAFERASFAFAEVASLLRNQADLLETAGGAVRGPTDALKSIVGAQKKPPAKPRKRAPAKPRKRAPRKPAH